MPQLTEEEYVAKSGNVCPACGGTDLSSTGPVETDTKIAWQPIECENCGATWNDCYTLTCYAELKTK